MKNLKLKFILEAADKVTRPFKGISQSSKILRTDIQQATGTLKKLESTSQTMDQFASIKMTAEKNAAALGQAQVKAQKLGQQLASTAKPTKKLRSEFKRARDEVLRLKNQQTGYQVKLSGLRQKLNTAGVSTKNLTLSERKLQQQIKSTTSNLTRYGNQLDTVRKKSNALAKAKRGYENTLSTQANLSFAGAAGTVAGGAILGAARSVVMPGINFEEQMSKVGALARVDKTSQAFTDLTNKARELGLTTAYSATEAAQGMQKLSMAGFEASETIAAMPGILNLAKAGDTDIGATADIASNILSGFDYDASEMGRVSDVLAATFTRTNVDLMMLGDSMKYVAPIAKEIGESVEEASAMAGLLGNIGIQGSMAGTALRAIHNRLAAPPKMAQQAIEKLGLSVKDAGGNMLPLVDILGQVAEKTKNMGSADRLGFFKKIAGDEAGTAFAALVAKGGAGEITKFVEILRKSQGEAKRIADAMGDNAAGDIKMLGSAWKDFNITLTSMNIQPMRDLLQFATRIVRSMSKWAKENPILSSTILKVVVAVGGTMAVMGALALAVAGILGPFAMLKMAAVTLGLKISWFGGTLGFVAKTVFPAMITGIRMIGVAMMANPIVAIITGIAIAALLIYQYWEPISEFFSGIWDNPKAAFTAFTDWFLDNIKLLISPIAWVTDKIGGLFGDEEKNVVIKQSVINGDKTSNIAPVKSPTAKSRLATAAVVTAAIASPVAAGEIGPSAARQNPQPISQNIEININAAPGMDTNQIAMAVRLELERINADNAARSRSGLYDE